MDCLRDPPWLSSFPFHPSHGSSHASGANMTQLYLHLDLSMSPAAFTAPPPKAHGHFRSSVSQMNSPSPVPSAPDIFSSLHTVCLSESSNLAKLLLYDFFIISLFSLSSATTYLHPTTISHLDDLCDPQASLLAPGQFKPTFHMALRLSFPRCNYGHATPLPEPFHPFIQQTHAPYGSGLFWVLEIQPCTKWAGSLPS